MAVKKPNIIMIMSDDVGAWNVSAYHRGMMGGSKMLQDGGRKN
jgi:arylsulfatase A-like enzyme